MLPYQQCAGDSTGEGGYYLRVYRVVYTGWVSPIYTREAYTPREVYPLIHQYPWVPCAYSVIYLKPNITQRVTPPCASLRLSDTRFTVGCERSPDPYYHPFHCWVLNEQGDGLYRSCPF